MYTRIFILTCFCYSKKLKNTYMFDDRERAEQIVVHLYHAMFDIY